MANQKGIRPSVALVCVLIAAVMFSFVVWSIRKNNATPSMLDASVTAVGVVLDTNTVLVVGKDFPTNNNLVEVVEHGASFTMMHSSSNQPKFLSEEEVLARQEKMRQQAQQQRR